MSYSNSHEVEMVPGLPTALPGIIQHGVNLGATGVQAEWSPGLVPHTVHAVGIIPRAVFAQTNPVSVKLKADISAQGTVTDVGTIVWPTTVTAAGEVIYWKPTYAVRLNPGRVLQASVTAAGSASTYAKIVLLVSPDWDQQANVTSMTKTT